jgi:prevent-host-death family protein
MLEAFSVTTTRKNLLPLIERIEAEPYRFMITKHGSPVAVVMSYEEYSRMAETLRILQDKEMTNRIRKGLTDIDHGDTIALDGRDNE